MRFLISVLSAALLTACTVPLPQAAAPPPAAPAPIAVCFTPAEHCAWWIVAAIDGAREEIRVQAYVLTAGDIIDALERAHRRGVDVEVILDRSQTHEDDADEAAPLLHAEPVPPLPGPRSADILTAAGIPVWIDRVPGIAHNKAIIIDRHLVIGGSYNYTRAAETENAENVTRIDSAEVAAQFLANWQERQAASQPYAPPSS
jgi:phospholipase D